MTLNQVDLDAIDERCCSQGDTSARRKPKMWFCRADGVWLFDRNDRPYLDLQMCNSAANFGYRSHVHVEAMTSQAATLPSLASEFMHQDRALLSEALVEQTRRVLGVHGRVHFSVGGAQAIDDALKLIGHLTGTTRVFAFSGSYHGRSIAAASISGGYRYRSQYNGQAQADFVPFPNCSSCPYDRELDDCDYYCVKQFERRFDDEGSGQTDENGLSECRAFVAEPVLGRGGYLAAPKEYFQRLKKILDRHNILLVIDEIQMGFYRTGRFWAIEHYSIVPDIIVFGKSITNGMFPLSGLWAREPLLDRDHWPVGSSHATYAGAPLAMALGLATLRLCQENDWATRAEAIGLALERACRRIAGGYAAIRHVHRLGAALSLDLRDQSGLPSAELARQVVAIALGATVDIDGVPMGLVLSAGGAAGNIIVLAPSLTITDTEIALFERLLHAVLAKALPPPTLESADAQGDHEC